MKNEFLAAKAAEKLNEQKKAVTGQKEKVMVSAVVEALMEFAAQDGEFAQAIVESGKALKDCMCAVAKGVGNSISDLEAYRRAVNFYFPGAKINFVMTVDLIGDAAAAEVSNEPMHFSLADLLEV